MNATTNTTESNMDAKKWSEMTDDEKAARIAATRATQKANCEAEAKAKAERKAAASAAHAARYAAHSGTPAARAAMADQKRRDRATWEADQAARDARTAESHRLAMTGERDAKHRAYDASTEAINAAMNTEPRDI